MRFDNTFVHELPGDKETTNSLRQVRLLVQHHQTSSCEHYGADHSTVMQHLHCYATCIAQQQQMTAAC
jgi:hypothetical protein